ncbi:OmpA family protein [Vibrio rotiferianus]|uniref:Outer membrane beta-barrel protein n=1 Tax=Vibrio rotiferianus TaxID=190895 RepID=A0A7Y4E160_9VIBR|nr:outer membrane beta-barrel protein [Vibrio rotiferianus]NOH47785.1 outer membrane beta-barrel protein [Vibrio rotiferianus]
MKKIALAVATVLAGGAMSNVALADTYIGGKLGYNALNDACHLDAPCDDDSFAAGMHIGYNFNEYVAAEYGVDYLGNFTANFNKAGKNTVDGDLWALTLAPKFNLPLTDSWNLFAKVGAAYMMAGDEKDFVPTGSLGAEYQINYNWSLRAEYQRYQDMSDDIINDMDADFFGIGFNYKFGSEPVAQKEVAQEVVETRPATRIVENEYPAQTATVQFGLESAELQDASAFNGTVELMNTYPQAQVEINGYSDTTGSEAYNQQLTEKRAQAVADHFQAEGIAADRMTVKGMGEANPVASNETREGREENRRVEVVVPAFQYQTEEAAQ